MSVTLHTNHGDVKLEIFCDSVPRTAFNFLALAASGYYDGTQFHRNVRGFMVQGGDPTGTGKGGESIWGGKFADEIRAELTHSARGILSMANSGPGTNAAQFFITYAKHPHLDNSQCPSCTAQCPMPAAAAPTAASQKPHIRILISVLPCADYTVFGKVIDGWEALSSIERTPCNEKNRPLNDVRIENLTIHANPLADQMIIFPTATGAPDIQL